MLFFITFYKGDQYKTFVKRNSKLDDQQFCNKLPVLLEFFTNKKYFPISFINVKISIWTFLFYKKNIRENVILFKITKARNVLLGSCKDVIFGLLLDIQVYFLKNIVSLLCSILDKSNEHLIVKSSLKLNNLWKLYGLLKDCSFSQTFQQWSWPTF